MPENFLSSLRAAVKEGANAKVLIMAAVRMFDQLVDQIDGKTIHHVGVPIHWGFSTTGRKGYLANNLTASVGDGNSLTPESKTFLVKVEKI